ncbi:MAG: SDR family NAD(P)-dependent oxidoreductase [Verrucomicrobiota bacterium]
MQLTNKVALITGGTRGIGAATALLLAEHGADVAIVGRQADTEAQQIRDRIQGLGRKCLLLTADVGQPEAARRCVRETAAQLGAPTVLVHSAGGPVNGGFLDLTPERWQAAFDVHLHAIFHLCQEAIPHMRQRQEGAIVLLSSAAGLRGVHTHTAYQVVKGALPQFARALAREFAPDHIRVNCVAPGVVRTAFHAAMPPEAKKHNLENRIPLRGEGTAEQVAALILQLITNDYITGETVAIDGGLTMRIA